MRGGIAGLSLRIWESSERGHGDGKNDCIKPPLQEARKSRGGFGAKDALEAGSGELDADELFSPGLGLADVDDATMGGKVRVGAAGERGAGSATRAILCQGNADFEVGADGDVETRDEGGVVAAQI